MSDNISLLEARLRQKPDDLEILHALGVAYLEMGDFQTAFRCFEQRINLAPDSAESYCSMGWACLHAGEFSKALEMYNKACALKPKSLLAISGRIDALYRSGEVDAAHEKIRKLFTHKNLKSKKARWDNCIAALRVYSKLCHLYGSSDECIFTIKSVLRNKHISSESNTALSFALASVYDKGQKYQEAYKYYCQANKLAGTGYSHHTEVERNNSIISSFNIKPLPEPAVVSDTDIRPIFIIGMPRSGTSLIEQILSTYTDVYAAGELITMAEIANTLSARCEYPITLGNLSSSVLTQAQQHYLSTVKKMAEKERFITDKMPANFMHLGLISLLFPNAVIIHAQRNPVDVCLSIFFQRFPNAHSYSFDLKNIALYYQEYVRLMTHWQRVLPVKIHNVVYEELVQDQEKVSRQLVTHCGLEWSNDCLDFHNAERVVTTASQEQVKKKMYTSSVNRWKHYEDFFSDDVKKILLSLGNTD